jgi:prepilin signal peptidase PulO-like enzyme (type II secretory pathway)
MLFQIIFLFILGSIIGSFLSVVIPRLHHDLPGILKGRSHCPKCKKQIPLKNLIPLISYILIKGKCQTCSKKISFFYPIIEFVTGFLFAISLPLLKMKAINPIIFDAQGINFNFDLGIFIFLLFCLTILIFIFFYDILFYSIDDRVLVPAIIIIFAFIAIINQQNIFPDFKSAIIGALIPTIFFGIQILISKGKWLGSGDLRIGVIMGLILGFPNIIIGLFISYLLGSLLGLIIYIKKGYIKNIKIPFGPFLTTSTFITLFFGDQIINWYVDVILR